MLYKRLSKSTEETGVVAKELLDLFSNFKNEKPELYKNALVVGLSGDLGSGKTTFTQRVAGLLGVEDQITSPTFVIEKIYQTKDISFPQFVHIDAYRLESSKELEVLGFKNLLSGLGGLAPSLIFIEWPEKVAEILHQETIMVRFKVIDETSREISIEKI